MAVKNVVLKIGAKGVKGTVKGLKSVAGGLTSIGKKAAIVSGGFAVLSTKLAGDFQKSLLEITTLLKRDLNEELDVFVNRNLKSLGKELTSVANSSGLALDSLAKAKYDIVSAGFSNAADSAKVLEQATKLAVGGVTTAAGAADILTSALNAFGEGADQADELSDALFTTVRLGKTTITELGASLGQVLPFAKSFNLTIEDVGSAMATLTAAGINTAESTTALKGAIVALESPSKGARDEMKKLGIEVKRNDDGTVDLINTVKQFEGLDPEVFSKLIPNVRAQLALKTLVNNMTNLVKSTKEFENTTGATETAFQKMLKAFNTQVSILKNNVVSVLIEIGNIIIENIQPHIEALNTEFKKLNEIGFDNLSAALKDQMPEILQTLQDAAVLVFKNIGNQVDLLKIKIMDAFNPFENFSEEIAIIESTTTEALLKSGDVLSSMFDNMYKNIISGAQLAKLEQDLLGDSTKNQGKETGNNDAKMKTYLKTLNKFDIRRKDSLAVDIQKVDVQEQLNLARRKSIFLRQQELEKELMSAMMSADSAKDAMKKVVRTNIMKGISGYIAQVFSYFPPLVAPIFAAGAGALVGGVVDEQLAKFADGGIVQGNPSQGDVVPVMATAGELILNQSQQNNLAGGMGGVTINIGGNFIGEEAFVRDTLIPEIERARTLA